MRAWRRCSRESSAAAALRARWVWRSSVRKGQRDRIGATALLVGPQGEVALDHAAGERRRRRPAVRVDGQLRSRAPQHRRGPHRLPRDHAHRQGDPRRRVPEEPGAAERHRAREERQRPVAPVRPRLGWRRAQQRPTPEGAAADVQASRPRGRSRAIACVPRWPRHAAAFGAEVCRCGRRLDARTRHGPHRNGDRSLLRDGSRQAMGARAEGV